MVYRGHVRDGRIELDEPVELPDGTTVTVEVRRNGIEPTPQQHGGDSVGMRLMRHAGTAQGLPVDAARNLDHYLYGFPKR